MMRLAFVLLVLAAPLAAAQERINKPVKVIIGFAPGGSVDLVARIVAERLSPRIGQPVVVENRPGGFVRVAIDACAARRRMAAPCCSHPARRSSSRRMPTQKCLTTRSAISPLSRAS